jgi:hypothetical protein
MKLSRPRDMKLLVLFAAVIITATLGWLLQQIGFKAPGVPGQAFVTVFTKEKTESVSLKAKVHPTSPWKDWLTVRVSGAHGRRERWLLVVQCPAAPATPAHNVRLYLEPGPQPSVTPVTVIASLHTGKSWAGYLRCFSAADTNQANSLSFANATLPALETDPAMTAAQAAPQMYAERDNSSHHIRALVEVFPLCSSSSPTTATISPAPSGTVSPQAVAGTPGGLPSTASPATVNTTPSPNTTTSSCYGRRSLGTTPDVYQLPASVATAEILEDVNLSGYRVDSIFPPGQFGESGQIAWRGIRNLSPSLFVTNLDAEHQLNKYTFFSGVLFGICGGAIVTLIVEFVDARRERRGKPGTAVADK